MDRRDLLRALAAGLLLPLQRPRRRARRGRPRPPWTFRLDRSLRWSLAARDGRAVVAGAEIAVAIGGSAPVPLAALQRVRRFQLADLQGGNAGWQIVGTVGGVEISAQFLDGPPPLVSVTARGLEASLSLEEIRFFDTSTADVPALSGRPTAWINGYQSSDPCRLAVLGPDADATSHWGLAILPRTSAHPAAFAFGVDDAGEGRFDCSASRVAAASRFEGRSVGAAYPPATATLAIAPGGDPLGALSRLIGGLSARTDVPTGWSARRDPTAPLTEADVLADLEATRAAFRPEMLRVLRLDDGYQRATGDWETHDGFPHGHRWLTDRIHAAGFQAGLWLAPLLVAERSGIPTAHPDWLLKTPDRDPLILEERADRGGRIYALDAAQVSVRDYLRDLVRHAVTEWGYDHLTLDRLRYATAGVHEGHGMSGAEAYRAALRALREGAGRAFITARDAPLQHAAGLVDAMRIGPDVGAGFDALPPAARNVALRAHYHGAAWLNDPGDVILDEPLTLEEARLWATIAAFSGGPAFASRPPASLSAERLDVLKRTLPVAPLDGRVFDVAREGSGRPPFPSWLLGRVDEGWWMLAALNWGEAPRRFTFSLADHGIRGPLLVYDVWEDRRRGDVDGRVSLDIAPRSAVVLSLRRRRRAPCVIGSTRHVVQGLDLLDERWDAGRRILTAQAVRLDERPYAVTIAVPPGLRPQAAASDPDAGASVDVAGSGAERVARLTIEQPPGEEISWEVNF